MRRYWFVAFSFVCAMFLSEGSAHAQQSCSPGSYSTPFFEVCSPCPSGSFCTGGTAQPLTCPAGNFCPFGSASPQICPDGLYCPTGSAAAIVCPAGSFCPSGSSAPTGPQPVRFVRVAASFQPSVLPGPSVLRDR